VTGLAALGVRTWNALALAVPGVYVTDIQLEGEPVGVAFAFANAAVLPPTSCSPIESHAAPRWGESTASQRPC